MRGNQIRGRGDTSKNFGWRTLFCLFRPPAISGAVTQFSGSSASEATRIALLVSASQVVGNNCLLHISQTSLRGKPMKMSIIQDFRARAIALAVSTITARGALIYNASKANKAVAVLDFGADKTSTTGDFTVQFPINDASSAVIRLA